ncbi:hypothetical protein Tco_0934503 [Tanacetum coccineum]
MNILKTDRVFGMELELILVKTANREVQLQAPVDGKKIIITKASVRCDLQLNDEEGMDCLPNATIFEELTRIGAKTTACNEFSSTITSAIICLATNQKFNFSKYIFESMVKNLENVSEEMGEGLANHTDPHHIPTIIQPSTSQPQKKQKPRKSKRKDTEVPQPSGPIHNVVDDAVYEEMDDSLERAATTATSLDAEQDKGNINKTQSKATLNEPSSLGTRSVIDLEKNKTPQAQEIISLKRRVKRLEKKGGSRTHKLKRLYKVGLSRRMESSEDEDMFGVHDLVGDVVVVETEVASKDVNLSIDEVTLAQALTALKSAKPKADKVMLQVPEQGTITTTTAATTITAASIRPKAKGLIIHE